MTIKIDIPNEQLSEKILWLLNNFKHDGVKITTSREKQIVSKNSTALNTLDHIIQTKSEHGIKLDNSLILNPHAELSRDIF